jgi:hypothetical protein
VTREAQHSGRVADEADARGKAPSRVAASNRGRPKPAGFFQSPLWENPALLLVLRWTLEDLLRLLREIRSSTEEIPQRRSVFPPPTEDERVTLWVIQASTEEVQVGRPFFLMSTEVIVRSTEVIRLTRQNFPM